MEDSCNSSNRACECPPAVCELLPNIFCKVRPEWEDPLNATGGHFQAGAEVGLSFRGQVTHVCQVQLKSSIGGAQIDEYWNNIVLGMAPTPEQSQGGKGNRPMTRHVGESVGSLSGPPDS